MHADEIAAKSQLDGAKLGALNRVETLQHTTCDMHTTARIMRLLATHYIYREVGPDTFANNRLSMALDTGKPVSELFSQFVIAFAFTVDLNLRSDSHDL
jgi:hypothetical protein